MARPVFHETHQRVSAALAARLTQLANETQGRHIYYERLHALLALASVAARTDSSTFGVDEPPSDNEQELGSVIGQAFHQGCKLADVALAAQLPPDRVVEIGRRTIRRTKWLDRLERAHVAYAYV
jgi:hypothetical protein